MDEYLSLLRYKTRWNIPQTSDYNAYGNYDHGPRDDYNDTENKKSSLIAPAFAIAGALNDCRVGTTTVYFPWMMMIK